MNHSKRPSWIAFCDFLKLVSALNLQPQIQWKWWHLLTWGSDQNQLLLCAMKHSTRPWPLLVEALGDMEIATETIHGEQGMIMVGVKMKMKEKEKEKEKERAKTKTNTMNTTRSGLKRRSKLG